MLLGRDKEGKGFLRQKVVLILFVPLAVGSTTWTAFPEVFQQRRLPEEHFRRRTGKWYTCDADPLAVVPDKYEIVHSMSKRSIARLRTVRTRRDCYIFFDATYHMMF